MNLRKLNYVEAEELLQSYSDEALVDVLGGSSRKLGDTAFSLLWRRNRTDLVIGALRDGKLGSRDGKVRALNFLLKYGRSIPEAFEIYRQYCVDRSHDVVSTALFGLVFWQDPRVIPYLESLAFGAHGEMVHEAISALRSRDVKKYSPYFHDAVGVWRTPA